MADSPTKRSALNREEQQLYDATINDTDLAPYLEQDRRYQKLVDQYRAKSKNPEESAKREFEYTNRTDARIYAIREKIRIYPDPRQDPAYRKMERDISEAVNKDDQAYKSQENMRSVQARESMFHRQRFARLYPEKTSEYAKNDERLARAVRNIERRDTELQKTRNQTVRAQKTVEQRQEQEIIPPPEPEAPVVKNPDETVTIPPVPLPANVSAEISSTLANRFPIIGRFNNFVSNIATKTAKFVKPVTDIASKLLGPLISKIAPLIAQIVSGPIGWAAAAASFIATHASELAKSAVALGVALSTAAFTSISAAAGTTATMTGIVVLITVPVLALIMFIINSGAYIVPPSDSSQLIAGPAPGGIVSEGGPGCPEGWPLDTSQGQSYVMTQGSFTPEGWTHWGLEAIDLTLYGPVRPSNIVVATHDGKVRWGGTDADDGLFVDLIGTCNGVPFRSRHVHFTVINPNIYDPVQDKVFQINVTKGYVLGIIGNTGYANTVHDHYEFRPANAGWANRFVNSPILMQNPFIPVTPTRGCTTNCNIRIP